MTETAYLHVISICMWTPYNTADSVDMDAGRRTYWERSLRYDVNQAMTVVGGGGGGSREPCPGDTWHWWVCLSLQSKGRNERCRRGAWNCVSLSLFVVTNRAVPDFGSGSGWNLALFPNPAEIRLRQKSYRSRIVLADLKSRPSQTLDNLEL